MKISLLIEPTAVEFAPPAVRETTPALVTDPANEPATPAKVEV